MEKLRLLSVLVSLAAIALSGCGGGGGDGTSGGSTLAEPIATSPTVRQLQAGDSLTYNVTGTTRAPVTGTATVTTRDASVQPYSTMHLFEVVTQLDLTVDGQPFQSTIFDYLAQDSTGRMMKLGCIVDDTNYFGSAFSADPIYCISPMTPDATWSYQVTYDDSTVQNIACTVNGMEAVNGRMAYKVTTSIETARGTGTRIDWFVPDLGYPAKMMWTLVTQGTALNLTADLASKSF